MTDTPLFPDEQAPDLFPDTVEPAADKTVISKELLTTTEDPSVPDFNQLIQQGRDVDNSLITRQQANQRLVNIQQEFTDKTNSGDVFGALNVLGTYKEVVQSATDAGVFEAGITDNLLSNVGIELSEDPETAEIQRQDILTTTEALENVALLREWRARIVEKEGEQSNFGMILDFIMTDLNPLSDLAMRKGIGDKTFFDATETAFEKDIARIFNSGLSRESKRAEILKLEKEAADGSGIISRNFDMEKRIVDGMLSMNEGAELDDELVVEGAFFGPYKSIYKGAKGAYRAALGAVDPVKGGKLPMQAIKDFEAGTETAHSTQFKAVEEAIEETLPAAVRPSGEANPLFGQVSEAYDNLPSSYKKILEESKFDVIGEAKLDKASQSFVRSVKDILENEKIVDFDILPTDSLTDVPEMYVIFGKADDALPFKTAKEALGRGNRLGIPESQMQSIPAPSGGYYLRHTKPVNENQAVGKIDVGVAENMGPVGEFLRSPYNYLSNQPLITGARLKQARLGDIIRAEVGDIERLAPKEIDLLENAFLYNQKTNRWFESPAELEVFFESKGLGWKPKYGKVYEQFRQLSDLSYFMTNRRIYDRLKGQGYETLEVNSVKLADDFNGNFITGKTLDTASLKNERVYDIEAGMVREAEDMTDVVVQELVDKGYEAHLLAIPAESMNKIGQTRVVIAKKGAVKRQPLHTQQVGYAPGLRRQYDLDYAYVVQQGNKVVTKSGSETLLKSSTRTMTKTVNEAKLYQESMEQARKIYNDFRVTGNESLAKEAFGALQVNRPWKVLRKAFDEGRLNPDVPFELARKGDDIPSLKAAKQKMQVQATNRLDDLDNEMIDLIETGSLVYSPRKDPLLDLHGKELTTIDPVSTLAKNLAQSVDVNTVAKATEVMKTQWINTHIPQALRTKPRRQLFEENLDALGTNKSAKQINEANKQRKAIKRLIEEDGGLGEWWKIKAKEASSLAHEAMGGGKASKAIFDKTNDFATANYAGFLRSTSFNHYLGLFTPHNFAIQGTQALVIAGSSRPDRMIPILHRATYLSAASKSPHQSIRKALANDMGEAFTDSPDAMRRMLDEFEQGGYQMVDRVNNMIESGGTGHLLSRNMAKRMWQKTAKASRWTYIVSEGYGRNAAFARAWLEKDFDNIVTKRALKTDEKNELLDLTIKYSFDMFEARQNPFQRGILGLPSQFLTYSIRLGEALLPRVAGGSPKWSGKQKGGLAATMFLLFGDKTTPFSQLHQDFSDTIFGKGSEAADIFELGYVDYIFKSMGQDTNYRGRVGPGGQSEQTWDRLFDADKSLIENFFGASSGIAYEYLKGTALIVDLLSEGEVNKSGLVLIETLKDNITSVKAAGKIVSALEDGNIETRSGDIAYPASPTTATLEALGVDSMAKRLAQEAYDLGRGTQEEKKRVKNMAKQYFIKFYTESDEAKAAEYRDLGRIIVHNADLPADMKDDLIAQLGERRNWWEENMNRLLELGEFKNAHELRDEMIRLYKATFKEGE